MAENILSVQNLTKEYPGFCLDHVSFSIPKGSIMGLIGENGAGKSTAIYAILDLIRKDSGSVSFLGKDFTGEHVKLKEEIGVAFDNLGFYETTTPRQAGKFSSLIYSRWDAGLYRSYLQKFQISEKKEIRKLSKGMKAKLGIALALSHHPKLLILDEATSGLDPVMRDEILDVFLDFVQDENHSILMSSHISSDLEKIADYITFLHKGKILFSREKDELIYRYGIVRCGEETFRSMDKKEALAYRKCDYQWEVLVADKESAKRKYRNAVVDNATIDDILLLYIKGGKPV